MDNELEVIRDEMEQTRASLADKLGALENQVRETVSGATEAVSSTVEGVKEVVGSVSDTVGSVAETFNVRKQVEAHPWAAVGAAVAAGFLAGQFVGRAGAPSARPHSLSEMASPSGGPPEPEPKQEESLLGSMVPDLGGVANTLLAGAGGLAVNSVMGVVRELITRGLSPEWKGELDKVVDSVASKLGGKPVGEGGSSQLLELLGLGDEKPKEDPKPQPQERPPEAVTTSPPATPANGSRQAVRAGKGRMGR